MEPVQFLKIIFHSAYILPFHLAVMFVKKNLPGLCKNLTRRQDDNIDRNYVEKNDISKYESNLLVRAKCVHCPGGVADGLCGKGSGH